MDAVKVEEVEEDIIAVAAIGQQMLQPQPTTQEEVEGIHMLAVELLHRHTIRILISSSLNIGR